MTIPVIPPQYDVAELEVASRCIFHLRSEDQSLTPLTGQVPTFSRAANVSITDSLGIASFTCPQHLPAHEPNDWDRDGIREHMCQVIGASDRLHYAMDARPAAFSWWKEFMQVGAMPSAGTALWSITNDAVSGARFVVDSSGSFWRCTHHNGSAAQTVTLAAAPASGSSVILYGNLYDDGSVQMWQIINFAAATNTARSSANALAASWGSGTARIRIGASGTGNYGSQKFKRLRVAPGLLDYATLSRFF